MKNDLKELFLKTARSADVVTVDNGPYCHFNHDEVRNKADNEIFSVHWHGEGHECRYAITEEAFDPENYPSIRNGIFRLLDSEGDPTEIRFYRLELLRP